MATCSKPQGSGVMSFLCDLDSGHEGPCRAQGNDRSLRARAEWEQAQKTLRETQGKPMTSAERWGDGEATGTPPPGFFRCKYHGVVHHNDQRSPKCMAWSSDHDGPMPTRIQRPQETMGDATVLGPLPDMPDDNVRPPMVYEQQGDKLVQQVADLDQPDPRVLAGETITASGGPYVVASQDQYDKTKDRPEDQPMPTPNDRVTAHEILIRQVQARLDLGIHRYGTGLQPFNGRNSAKDALEELIDFCVYFIVHETEKAELLPLVTKLRPMVGMSPEGNQIIDRLEAFLSGASA